MPQSFSGGKRFNVEIQGLQAVIDHMLGFAYLFQDFAYQIVDVTAEIGVEEAQRLVPVRTGATQRSIHKDPNPKVFLSGMWTQAYGPETDYSPYIEYGTSDTTAHPFMTPSADLAERAFVPAVISFLNLLAGGETAGFGSGPGGRVTSHPRIRSPFGQLRSFLYSGAKALGDVSVLGGREIFGPIRASMYSMAKMLGDVGALTSGAIGQRVSNRLTGRATGRLVGFGSASLSHSRTYSGFVGGAAGHRIYQRVAGHFGVASNLGFTGVNLPGFGG